MSAQPQLKWRKPRKTEHALHKTWENMIRRCHSETHERYKDYGGRGIKVCDRWRYDFWAFVADVGERPEGKTLDRINNDGNYEPRNCRWATSAQQAENSRGRLRGIQSVTARDAQILSLFAEGLNQSEVALRFGVSHTLIHKDCRRLMRQSGCRNLIQLGIWYALNYPERLVEWARPWADPLQSEAQP